MTKTGFLPQAAAVSLRGHDSGELFIVLRHDEKYVFLVNGKQRKLEKPKRKNIRHVKFLPDSVYSKIAEELAGNLTDARLRRVLAVLRKHTV